MRGRSLVHRSLAIAAVSVWVVTCADPKSRIPAGPSATPLSSVEIIGPASVAPGALVQFSAIAHLSDGTTKIPTTNIVWQSSNQTLMWMSSDGVAHGMFGVGEVTLSAAVSGARASREVVIVPDGTYRLVGRVTDGEFPTAGVAGANVQASPGSVATTTDTSGNYKLYGLKADSEVRVTRDGYQPLVQTVHLTGHATQNFQLTPTGGPRLNFAGSYTLTIDAAPGCSGPESLPGDLQHRSYQATVTQNTVTLLVTLTEPRFKVNNGLGNYFTGAAGVGGATFTLIDYVNYYYYYNFRQYPNVVEQLPDGTFLVVAGTVVTNGTAAGLSGQLNGSLAHYKTLLPVGFYLGECYSTAHQFRLTPR